MLLPLLHHSYLALALFRAPQDRRCAASGRCYPIRSQCFVAGSTRAGSVDQQCGSNRATSKGSASRCSVVQCSGKLDDSSRFLAFSPPTGPTNNAKPPARLDPMVASSELALHHPAAPFREPFDTPSAFRLSPPATMSQPSLANFIIKRPWLKRWMLPLSEWYKNAAGYRKLGLRYACPLTPCEVEDRHGDMRWKMR